MSEHCPPEIETLFGKFKPPEAFEPLKPLGECEEEKLTPIIEGLLYENTFTLMHGKKATYKSWLAAYIAVCVALGKHCFGRSVKQGKVVYIYGEGNMKRRLKRICRAFGEENPTNIYPYYLRADLASEEAQRDLKMHIPPDTILIVIDNYEKYWESDIKDEPVNEATKFMRELREYTTVLLVHHDTKSSGKRTNQFDRSKGLTKLIHNADADISIILEGKNKNPKCEIYVRESEPFPTFNFTLSDLDNDAIICKETKDSYSYTAELIQQRKDSLNLTIEILKKKMKEPLNKTNIYNLLKGKGIRGLSSRYFFDTMFDQLRQQGWLRELESDKGSYEFIDKGF